MIKILFKLLSALPLSVLHGLGWVVGWFVYGLSATYRRKIQAYSKIAFPDCNTQRLRVVRGSVKHAGMAFLELPYLWGLPTQKGVLSCAEVVNWEVMERAKAKGKGVILLTPHMGSFEAAAQIVSTLMPITVLYRPNRIPQVQEIIQSCRARNNLSLAPTNLGGVKVLLKALKRGEVVGLLPDQVPSTGEGVWAAMFGRSAYTMTLPSRLQQATGATVVLAIGFRKPGGRGFRLEIDDGPAQLSADLAESATQVNAQIEKLILKYPEQYYWGYERFKVPKGK